MTTPKATTREILQPFAEAKNHLRTNLNIFASDMIRDRALVAALDQDPVALVRKYAFTETEITALRARDVPALYRLGLHPFLLVRFAGMVGILEYWQALGAPGRDGERQ